MSIIGNPDKIISTGAISDSRINIDVGVLYILQLDQVRVSELFRKYCCVERESHESYIDTRIFNPTSDHT